MKVVQINTYGGIDTLQINETEKPKASEGQVLVDVVAASLNPFDWKVREGYTKDYIKLEFPAILGGDFSGTIVEVDEKVADFKIGDEVYGQAASYGGGTGAFAGVLAASVNKIALKPKNINFIEAASLPLVGVSSIQALEEHIELQAGQKILIHGGAGGIGSIAVQIAKALGAHVVATSNAQNVEYVKSLGADDVIDYKNENFEDKLSDFDAVFDTVGGEESSKLIKILKRGGTIVSMSGQPSEELAKEHEVTAIGQYTDGSTQKLNRLKELVEAGKVKAQVDKVFSLDEIKEAFTRLEKNHPRGKVVLKIKE